MADGRKASWPCRCCCSSICSTRRQYTPGCGGGRCSAEHAAGRPAVEGLALLYQNRERGRHDQCLYLRWKRPVSALAPPSHPDATQGRVQLCADQNRRRGSDGYFCQQVPRKGAVSPLNSSPGQNKIERGINRAAERSYCKTWRTEVAACCSYQPIRWSGRRKGPSHPGRIY